MQRVPAGDRDRTGPGRGSPRAPPCPFAPLPGLASPGASPGSASEGHARGGAAARRCGLPEGVSQRAQPSARSGSSAWVSLCGGKGRPLAVLGPVRAPRQGRVGRPPRQTAGPRAMGTVLRTQLNPGRTLQLIFSSYIGRFQFLNYDRLEMKNLLFIKLSVHKIGPGIAEISDLEIE